MLLEIKNLSVEYSRGAQKVPALRGVSLNAREGEILGIIGESGCGKSTLALAALRLIAPHEGKITSGEILFDGRDILKISASAMRGIRGRDIGIVFQDPFTSINPVLKIRDQVEEAVHAHDSSISAQGLSERASELMELVSLRDGERILNSYPHQISGGQRQRILIAMAMANQPRLLIADEPTTALDVTVQKEILELLASLQKKFNMGVILITHHLGIVANYTQNVAVLYAGEAVEIGKTRDVILNPQHPYTRALLRSVPEAHAKFDAPGSKTRLETIGGMPPDPAALPSGCIFHPRCPLKVDECVTREPELRELKNPERRVACHLAPLS